MKGREKNGRGERQADARGMKEEGREGRKVVWEEEEEEEGKGSGRGRMNGKGRRKRGRAGIREGNEGEVLGERKVEAEEEEGNEEEEEEERNGAGRDGMKRRGGGTGMKEGKGTGKRRRGGETGCGFLRFGRRKES